MIGGGILGGILAGKCVYECFLREKTDTEELTEAEDIYTSAHHKHQTTRLAYDIELELILSLSLDREKNSHALKQVIYQKRGIKYPFIDYVKRLEEIIVVLESRERTLSLCKNTLCERRLALLKTHSNKKMSTHERAYFIEEYENWSQKITHLKDSLAVTISSLSKIKQWASSLDEYCQERLLMRLDRLENRLESLEYRPTNHYVYVSTPVQTFEQRLDNFENRISCHVTTSY